MKRTSIAILFVTLAACGGGGAAGPDAGGDGGNDGPLQRIALPQAVDGAMRANPVAQPVVPLYVTTDGLATKILVRINGELQLEATRLADGRYTVDLNIATLGEGEHTLRAIATGADASIHEAMATLVLGNSGKQLTSVASDGNAGTPRLHAVGDELWLTWTDGTPKRVAWMQRIDGAGRFQGDRYELASAAGDVLYARAAFGDTSVAVLSQTAGGPYSNAVSVRSFDGTMLLEPIPLDPDGAFGSFGGDIRFDGSGFVLVWRVNDGAGGGEVRWMRIAEDGHDIIGPVSVARSGNDDPNGGFLPISFIHVAPVGDGSVVSFNRDLWDTTLDLAVPKCQVARVDRDGVVTGPVLAANGGGFYFHHECRAFPRGDRAVVLWGAADLTSAENEPPTGFYSATTDADGVLEDARGNGTLEVTAALHRSEVHLVGASDQLMWLDERSYVDLQTGRIQLYTAPLGGGTEVVFPHARFISGTSQLNGAAVGGNTVMVWIDERHGGGITDPRPEVWLDTVWR